MLIGPLSTIPSQRTREAAKRKRTYELMSASDGDVERLKLEGWAYAKKLRNHKTHLKRPLPLETQLENRVWFLFYLLGYPELGGGRGFTIRFTRKNSQTGSKQIDVFAKDDETVAVVECKVCEKPRKRSLQKDIEEFANLKGHIAQAIKDHYGASFKPKILWFFATQNVHHGLKAKCRLSKVCLTQIVSENGVRVSHPRFLGQIH